MFEISRRQVVVLLVVLACIPGSFVAGRVLHASMTDAPARADDPCVNDLRSACWTEYYEVFLEDHSAAEALHDFKMKYQVLPGARTFCHPVLHVIGKSAGVEYGSVAAAYAHGDTLCRSGYYHGVLEGRFATEGGERLIDQLDSICSAVRGDGYTYNYYSCVHGIGHGLMAFFGHDIFDSLRACNRLSGAWEQSSCAGGVFMENVTSDSDEMPSRFLKKDDPSYPCNAVEEKFVTQCYLMQSSYMLKIFDGDFVKTFGVCRAAGIYAETCFQSIGRDVSAWSYGDIDTAITLCGIGLSLDERTHCLLGAAADYILSYGEEAARSLCTQGEEGARALCVERLEWHLSTMR